MTEQQFRDLLVQCVDEWTGEHPGEHRLEWRDVRGVDWREWTDLGKRVWSDVALAQVLDADAPALHPEVVRRLAAALGVRPTLAAIRAVAAELEDDPDARRTVVAYVAQVDRLPVVAYLSGARDFTRDPLTANVFTRGQAEDLAEAYRKAGGETFVPVRLPRGRKAGEIREEARRLALEAANPPTREEEAILEEREES